MHILNANACVKAAVFVAERQKIIFLSKVYIFFICSGLLVNGIKQVYHVINTDNHRARGSSNWFLKKQKIEYLTMALYLSWPLDSHSKVNLTGFPEQLWEPSCTKKVFYNLNQITT